MRSKGAMRVLRKIGSKFRTNPFWIVFGVHVMLSRSSLLRGHDWAYLRAIRLFLHSLPFFLS